MAKVKGELSKLKSELENGEVKYWLRLGVDKFDLNSKIGKKITLKFTDEIYCTACGKSTNKSYSQGHCYPCMQSLASCDMCILKPETCHFDKGTCREPEWAESHCMRPHYVYLSLTSGVKVGITRDNQLPTRWIDQGAVKALPILKVKNRHTSGLIEVEIAKHVGDKTNWRKMLKGDVPEVDLIEKRDLILKECKNIIKKYEAEILDEEVVEINYPITKYPEKVSSLSFEKTDTISSKLLGIKGQYLILEDGVLNLRKHTAYSIQYSN